MWTKKRQDQVQKWKVFLKKDTAGGCQICPHSPRSAPTNLDVSFESELIHDIISWAEPFSSGSNKNLSVPIQKLVQRSKSRGVGNIPKALAGGHELLLKHQELSGLVEDHRALRRMDPILLQRQGENPICAKDIPKLKEWTTLSGEGEYNNIEFTRTIDILQKDFHLPDEIIVGKLHSLSTRTAKKWYYKLRQDHGKHDWPWWKSEIITKWAKHSWRFKM
ncbi:hypothetical protein O181_116191 [Austropuccinia psidii MF-1]|uniref:Uncharacterized protein n=1 Tax=Austropuccinia psidii MF-1 TaxID=1389203 RepID=A0A9Q3KAA2_9BASI|nr:hypothetical protein [Austropuccinia psidii MF-1]